MLFYAVTGENPPDALTRMKVDTVADALARAHERYTGPFLDAIAWALEPDEKKRPQTVGEWRRRILGDVAEEAAPAPDFVVDEFGAEATARPGPATDPATGPATMKAPPTAPPTAPATARPAGLTGSPDTQDISRFLEQREELDRAVKAKFQRVLSVMFTDLKGSTAIAEASGDIAVRAMLKRYHDLCLIAVKRHGGTLVKTIGDGSLSHFEDADAACRAACDIQRGMEEINLSRTYKTLLLARIGIHTGECILEKNDIFGDVVNTASRFESSANPGEILVSEDTYNALPDKSEFYARFDREVTLKGKSMPFKAYIVFWDPKEVELDTARPREAVAEKRATPAWKLALYVAVPVLAILVAAIWITGGDKFAGESRRTIEHSVAERSRRAAACPAAATSPRRARQRLSPKNTPTHSEQQAQPRRRVVGLGTRVEERLHRRVAALLAGRVARARVHGAHLGSGSAGSIRTRSPRVCACTAEVVSSALAISRSSARSAVSRVTVRPGVPGGLELHQHAALRAQRALLAAGGRGGELGVPPADHRVGHLHLPVDDLQRRRLEQLRPQARHAPHDQHLALGRGRS